MAYRKTKIVLWAILATAFGADLIITPAPSPDESALHYILTDDVSMGSFACAVIMSICLVTLFFVHLDEKADEQYRRDQAYLDELIRKLR